MADQPTIEERLAAARAKREAAEARREGLRKVADLEEEEREAVYQTALAEFEEKHGPTKIRAVRIGPHLVVLKRGIEVLWKKFQTAAERAGKNPIPNKAVEDFVTPCVVFSALNGREVPLSEFLEEQPASLSGLATQLADLYGLKTQEDEGK